MNRPTWVTRPWRPSEKPKQAAQAAGSRPASQNRLRAEQTTVRVQVALARKGGKVSPHTTHQWQDRPVGAVAATAAPPAFDHWDSQPDSAASSCP